MPVIPCTTVVPVTGIVTFDVPTFLATYPEFTGLASGIPAVSPQLSAAFGLSQTILNNTCCSRVSDANLRDTLLQMLTAHIAFLLYGSNNGAGSVTPPPGVVGRINTATEGSVSVGAEFGGNGGPTQDWYTSTRYGALYWVATAAYRTARYIPGPDACIAYSPYSPGYCDPSYLGLPPCGC